MTRVGGEFEAIGLKLWVDYACWLFCDVFPRWREAVLLRKIVRRMQRAVADMTVRGATRQWVFDLWCLVCSTRIAVVVKAATTIEATTKIAVDAADVAEQG
jgi:hypothetical protein